MHIKNVGWDYVVAFEKITFCGFVYLAFITRDLRMSWFQNFSL